MDKYVIIDEEDGMMLATIGIKRVTGYITQEHTWTRDANEALHFKLEEAEATISFINDVIDWELAQQLQAVKLPI